MNTAHDTTTAPGASRSPADLGEFERHTDAQRLVHRRSEDGFSGTTARACWLGAAVGAWVGLIVGMLLALPAAGPVSPLHFLGSLGIGAVSGAALGLVGHWVGRGRRRLFSAKA